MTRLRMLLVLGLAATITLAACDATAEVTTPDSRVSVLLTDAPLEEATSLVVEFGRVDLAPADGDAGIVTISENPGEIDVLTLQNGVVHELGDAVVPDGSYSQIRLIVESATLFFGPDEFYDVKVPSGSESGLKILVDPPIVADDGSLHEVIVDFDVLRAVVETPPGSGNYLLKPTAIRAYSEAGAVEGTVTDSLNTLVLLEDVQVEVLKGDDVVTSTFTGADGFYGFAALPAGVYDLRFSHPDYLPETQGGVVVQTGATTEVNAALVDATSLEPEPEPDPIP
jgi:hypothetical protein